MASRSDRIENRLEQIEERVDNLSDNTYKQFNIIIRRLDSHLGNHHGPRSRIAQTGWMAVVVAFIGGMWQLFTRFGIPGL